MKITNVLTLSRFFLIFIIAFLLYAGSPAALLWSIGLFLLAAFTDWADGYIARKYDKKTVFGTFFDPLADKMLILTALFIFVDLGLLPLWMILLVMFREFLVTGVRQVCSTPKKIVGANWMGKSKFIVQLVVVVYLQIVLYLQSAGQSLIGFNPTVGYYLTLAMVLLSLGYAANFLWWHRQEILSGI
jgi:CDP-diacylglycerol--glycerol-3-phosphate 3-phosphatidyltransferase